MAPHSPVPPSFYKILFDVSAPQLVLPSDFVSKHLKNKIPKDPIIIKCVKGGYSWQLEIEKLGEFYCFTHGWNNVVQDINLDYMDVLVFWLVDESTFMVLILSPNGCEKDLPPNIQHDSGIVDVVVVDDDVDDDDEDGDINGHDGDLFFKSTISKSHKIILRLPVEFDKLAGINGDADTIKMKNLNGEESEMALRIDKTNKRFYLSSGWPKFMQSNKLSEGDECLFKFIKSEGKLSLARITKKERSGKKPTPHSKFPAAEVVKRKRGRPRLEHGCLKRAKVVKRKRGRPRLEHGRDVECEEGCVEVVKRPRGRPRKRQHGTPGQQIISDDN